MVPHRKAHNHVAENAPIEQVPSPRAKAPSVGNSIAEIIGQADGLLVPRYAGLSTFGQLPRLSDVPSYDIAVVGVPFDTGVSYRPGARFGPSYIRQASRLLRPYNPSLDVAPFRAKQVVDGGDLDANPFNIEEAIQQIETGAFALIADGQRLVTLGGDHTIALPLLRAMNQIHGPVALVHFDAHLDTWPSYFGAAYTHGTPFRRASEEGLFLSECSAHVGIRGSLYDRGDLLDDKAMGFRIFDCIEIDEIGVSSVIERLREQIGEHPTYVSVDIDVLDPAYAPATGTPEMGGLHSRELLRLIRGFAGANLVGADIVEVAPAYDQAEITAVAAANLAYEFISLFAQK